MMKYINNNDVFEIMNEIKNKYKINFDVNEYNNNSFFIDYVELIGDDENIDEFYFYCNKNYLKILNYINNNYHVKINSYNNKNDKCIEIILDDPLYVDVVYNKDLIKDIFKNNIDLINNVYDELINDDVDEIIDDNIEYIFKENKNLSIYNIIQLFNNIYNEFVEIDVELLYVIKLFKYVYDDLKKFINDIYVGDKFKIDLNNKYSITSNNFLSIYNIDDIYENYLLYDLNENIDDELIDVFDIDIVDDINDYEFYENNYLNNLNFDIDIDYNIDYDVGDNYILLSIDNLFEIADKIIENNIDKKFKYLNLFDIDNIDNVFECLNNSYIDNDNVDEFLYLLFDNQYELLIDDQFYYQYYYYDKFDNKYENIYDLKKGILNYLSNLNLNKSFKFDDDVYEIF